MLLSLLLACSAEDYALTGAADSVSLDCGFVSQDVAWDDGSVVGTPPGQFLAEHLGTWDAEGTWDDGGRVAVHAAIGASGSLPQWVTAEGGDAGMCGDRLIIPIAATLSTADGSFAERFEVDWVILPEDAAAGGTLLFGGEREDESLDGSFREADVDVADGESVEWLTVAATHGPDGLHGRIEATVFGEDDAHAESVLTW